MLCFCNFWINIDWLLLFFRFITLFLKISFIKTRRHLDEKLKKKNCRIKDGKDDLSRNFFSIKKENIKISLLSGKKIGLKYERKGSMGRKSGSGHPRASISNDEHRLKLKVLKERKTTFAKMVKEFKTTNGNSFFRMTLSRRLHEIVFSSKRCTRMFLLTKKNITDRKTFAFYYDKKDAVGFSNVIWSEESQFWLSSDVPEYCIRRSVKKYNPSCIKMTVNHGNGGIWCGEPADVGKLMWRVNKCKRVHWNTRRSVSTNCSTTHDDRNNDISIGDNAPTHTAKVT